MAVWPSTLPDLSISVSEARQDGTIRTPMGAGPAKSRRRFSAVSRAVSAGFVAEASHRATFDTFFADTLAEGSLEFDMADPNDGTTQSWRFTAPPSYEALKSAAGVVTLWRISLSLEILP